jgi:CRISPR-associated protein Cas1
VKHHLNTLYVTTQNTYLAAEGETVAVKLDRETKLRIPLHVLESIVCFGSVSCSPFLMGRCAERGVGLSFLTEHGRFLARVHGPVSGNVLLRKQQYKASEDHGRAATLAKAFVAAKILNCRSVLMRAARDHPEGGSSEILRAAAHGLAASLERLARMSDLDAVRGVEGDAASLYFGTFDAMIVRQKGDFRFAGRTRRPPTDAVNALLSFAYTLLAHDVASALEAVGLDPQVGFLHRDRPGRPGLALDLMEELRPVLADRLVLSLINREQVRSNGFELRETGAVLMDNCTRKTFLESYQERKAEEIRHPYLEERTTVGMLPHLQALLLARHLRGDIDGYPPFIWK